MIRQRRQKLGGVLELGVTPIEQSIDGESGPRHQSVNPLSGAGDLHALRLGVGAQAGGKAHRSGSEAIAATLALHPHAVRGTHRERRRPLAIPGDAPRHRLRGQTAGDARIVRVVKSGVGNERAGQTVGCAVEALARHPQQRLGGRQRPRRGAQLGAAVVLAARPAGEGAARQAIDAADHLGAHRHRDLGGSGRCWSPAVGGKIDQRHVGFMADSGDQRDRAVSRRPHDNLFVERPQILNGPAAARHDKDLGPGDRAIAREGVESANGGGDLIRGAIALHPHRPHQNAGQKAVGKPVEDVANDRPGRRCDDADDRRQIRQALLTGLIKKALRRQLALALFQERHQRPDAGRRQTLDDDLIGRTARISGEPAGGHDLKPFFGLDAHAGERHLPDHRVDARALILESEIGMARRLRPAIAGDFAANPHVIVGVLDCALQRRREFGDGPLRCVDALLVHGAPV
jgi:hypothetical protein